MVRGAGRQQKTRVLLYTLVTLHVDTAGSSEEPKRSGPGAGDARDHYAKRNYGALGVVRCGVIGGFNLRLGIFFPPSGYFNAISIFFFFFHLHNSVRTYDRLRRIRANAYARGKRNRHSDRIKHNRSRDRHVRGCRL